MLHERFTDADDFTELVYDPPLELQIPSAAELSDSPLPSPASSPSTESDLNSPEFQPSSIVSDFASFLSNFFKCCNYYYY